MKIKPHEEVYSLTIRKKMGHSGMFGFYVFGTAEFGVAEPKAGIYQRRVTGYNNTGRIPSLPRKQYFVRMRDYAPTNPRTELQQQGRSKFAQAVEAWQGLTDSERRAYNERKNNKKGSGYNLFISEYMNTN